MQIEALLLSPPIAMKLQTALCIPSRLVRYLIKFMNMNFEGNKQELAWLQTDRKSYLWQFYTFLVKFVTSQ